jgi:dinuclear metal center YbgI/SA1388 family protein
VAARDEILAFAAELLDLGNWPDYGPQGMQVEGADEVSKVVCAVSASLELFELAAERSAELVVVHHGILWDNESRVIDGRVRRRLETLFDAEITLAAYHLALDAHPEVGNNALLARELDVAVDAKFADVGVGGSTAHSREELLTRIRQRINSDALVLGDGPEQPGRVAIVSGGAPKHLAEAAAQGYGLYLTGEPAEPSLQLAKELGVTLVAAGHHATEKLGVQALTQRLAERFGLQWEFVDVPNPV